MRGNFLNSKGFTLIEILASVVLLAVVISISLSIFPNMFRTNDVNQESLDAVAIAKSALVKVKNNHAASGTDKIDFEKLENGTYVPTETQEIQGYEVKYIIEGTGVTAEIGTNPSASLNLYTVTIQVLERGSVRATNYGYVTGEDFLP